MLPLTVKGVRVLMSHCPLQLEGNLAEAEGKLQEAEEAFKAKVLPNSIPLPPPSHLPSCHCL